jgi:hypothetical protein
MLRFNSAPRRASKAKPSATYTLFFFFIFPFFVQSGVTILSWHKSVMQTVKSQLILLRQEMAFPSWLDVTF